MTTSSSKPSALQKHFLDFDIDNYLNPICPRSRLDLLPTFISRWFGYRAPNSRPQPRLPNIGIWLSAFLGGFIGIAIITNTFRALPLLGNQHSPLVIASFGAAAILEYNTIESPLSQPRNLIVGHFLSALVGVAVTKGFERLPYERFDDLRWLAGSISVGLASFVMGATKTVHPPAGATALLASTSLEITVIGWWLLPLVLLASSLMCASALIINNITRRWPLYWWTAADLSKKTPDIEHAKDVRNEKYFESDTERSGSEDSGMFKATSKHNEDTGATGTGKQAVGANEILLTADEIILPDWWQPDDWEKEVLEIFRDKLHSKSAPRHAARHAAPHTASKPVQKSPGESQQASEAEPQSSETEPQASEAEPQSTYHTLVTGS